MSTSISGEVASNQERSRVCERRRDELGVGVDVVRAGRERPGPYRVAVVRAGGRGAVEVRGIAGEVGVRGVAGAAGRGTANRGAVAADDRVRERSEDLMGLVQAVALESSPTVPAAPPLTMVEWVTAMRPLCFRSTLSVHRR